MKLILFQGDSITDAGRPRENDMYMGFGYATHVQGELGIKYPGEYMFLNRGISGNRIVDLYARIKKDLINLKPDIISILIGVNDVGHEVGGGNNGVDPEKYFKIYCMMIEEIRDSLPDSKIIIMEPFVLNGSATNSEWEAFYTEVPKRAAKARMVAEKYGLTFVPLQEIFDEAEKICPAEYWLRDGVHPTTMGHALIKNEWIKAFEQIVKEKE